MTAFQHDQDIAELHAAGHTNQQIAAILGIHRNTVTNARRRLGLSRRDNTTEARRRRYTPVPQATLEATWRVRTQPGPDGHLLWTGPRATDGGQPVMRFHGHTYQAARVAWSIRHRADPVGSVRVDCGEPLCVNADHLTDTATRQRHNTALRFILGRGPVQATCGQGHAASEQRVDGDGWAYCNGCHQDAKRAARLAA